MFNHSREARQWLVASTQTGLHQEYKEVLAQLDHSQLLYIDKCPTSADKPWDFNHRCQQSESYPYPQILQVGVSYNSP